MTTKLRKGFARPDDPILVKRAKAIPKNKITSEGTQNIINKLFSYAYPEQADIKKPVLVGLAAPQVKISKRIILVDIGADGKGKVSDLRVYINPKITWKSKGQQEWYEGCFSTSGVCGIVLRPKSLRIKAYNQKGDVVNEKWSGYVARIFQHEIDHLNGIEFVQHIKNDQNLHWVEEHEFPKYRDEEGWRAWPIKCTREKWEKIKGIN